MKNIGGANTGFAKQTKDAEQVKHDTTAQCFLVGSQIVTQGEKHGLKYHMRAEWHI